MDGKKKKEGRGGASNSGSRKGEGESKPKGNGRRHCRIRLAQMEVRKRRAMMDLWKEMQWEEGADLQILPLSRPVYFERDIPRPTGDKIKR